MFIGDRRVFLGQHAFVGQHEGTVQQIRIKNCNPRDNDCVGRSGAELDPHSTLNRNSHATYNALKQSATESQGLGLIGL